MGVQYRFDNDPFIINQDADNFETRRYIKDENVIGGWTQVFLLDRPRLNEKAIFVAINSPKNQTALQILDTYPNTNQPIITNDEFCNGSRPDGVRGFPNWGIPGYFLERESISILNADQLRTFFTERTNPSYEPQRHNSELFNNLAWLHTIDYVCSVNGGAIEEPLQSQWESWEHITSIPTNGIATAQIKLFKDGQLIQTVERLNANVFGQIIESCPSGTCAVACGEIVCCYGSDGIAVTSFARSGGA